MTALLLQQWLPAALFAVATGCMAVILLRLSRRLEVQRRHLDDRARTIEQALLRDAARLEWLAARTAGAELDDLLARADALTRSYQGLGAEAEQDDVRRLLEHHNGFAHYARLVENDLAGRAEALDILRSDLAAYRELLREVVSGAVNTALAAELAPDALSRALAVAWSEARPQLDELRRRIDLAGRQLQGIEPLLRRELREARGSSDLEAGAVALAGITPRAM